MSTITSESTLSIGAGEGCYLTLPSSSFLQAPSLEMSAPSRMAPTAAGQEKERQGGTANSDNITAINGKHTKDDEQKSCTNQRKDGEEILVQEQQQQADHHGSSPSITSSTTICSTATKKRKYSSNYEEEEKKEDLAPGPNEVETDNATTTTAVKKSGSFLGRRGDPRMHRAVAARLARPEISLLQALLIGGFQFPGHTNEMSIKYSSEPVYDSDNTSLSQRKNQLSRRLRHIRQRRQKKGHSQNAQPNSQGLKQTFLADQSPGIDSNNFSVFGAHRGPLQGGRDVSPNKNHSLLLQTQHQQQIQLLRKEIENEQRLLVQGQLALHALANQPSHLLPTNNATSFRGNMNMVDRFHNPALRFLRANNLVPMSPTSSGMTHQVSPAPIGNSPDLTHDVPRMQSVVSWYEKEKRELKRRALVAAGFRVNEIDESLLVSMDKYS